MSKCAQFFGFCFLTWMFAGNGFLVSQSNDELAKSKARGKSVYDDFCITCHLASGEGVKGIFPTLVKSDFFDQREATIRAVKYGQKGPITVNGVKYSGIMPAPGLTDPEVADVMNYILTSWGNSGHKMVTPAEVKSIVKQ